MRKVQAVLVLHNLYGYIKENELLAITFMYL